MKYLIIGIVLVLPNLIISQIEIGEIYLNERKNNKTTELIEAIQKKELEILIMPYNPFDIIHNPEGFTQTDILRAKVKLSEMELALIKSTVYYDLIIKGLPSLNPNGVMVGLSYENRDILGRLVKGSKVYTEWELRDILTEVIKQLRTDIGINEFDLVDIYFKILLDNYTRTELRITVSYRLNGEPLLKRYFDITTRK